MEVLSQLIEELNSGRLQDNDRNFTLRQPRTSLVLECDQPG